MNEIVLDFSKEYKDRIHWKRIVINGKKTKYQICSNGDIRNKKTGKILKSFKNPQGYEIVKLSNNNESVTYRVNRLVLSTFQPITDANNYEVNHIDEDKANNKWSNLNWLSRSENLIHTFSKRKKTKNDKKKIHEVCKLLEEGLSIKEVSIKTDVKEMTVTCIYYGYSWRSISQKYNFKYKNNMGSDNPNVKHTEEQIHQVCKLLEKGLSTKDIHKITNVSRKTISDVYDKLRWLHISKYYKFNGKMRGNSKYSIEQIHQVCKLLEKGIISQAEISRKTNVSKPMVNIIKSRRNWTHISNSYRF